MADGDGKDKGVAICNICGALLQLGTRSGTSSLMRHLASKHPPVHKAIEDAAQDQVVLASYYGKDASTKQAKKSRGPYAPRVVVDGGNMIENPHPNSGSGRSSNSKFTKPSPHERSTVDSTLTLNAGAKPHKESALYSAAAKCLDAHVMYAADRNRPFSEFDEPSFYSLRQSIAQAALTGSRATKSAATTEAWRDELYQVSCYRVKTRANAIAQQIQQNIVNMIHKHKAPLVGVLHHWRERLLHESEQNPKSCLSFRIHWIQDFTPMSCVIAVDMDTDAMDWIAKLRAWNLGSSKETSPSCILTDLKDTDARSCGESSIECLDHMLQKVANVAFKAYFGLDGKCDCIDVSEPLAEALVVAFRLSQYFDQNESAMEALKATQKRLKPQDEVPDIVDSVGVQWWATVTMIQSLLHYREALDAFFSNSGEGPRSPSFRNLSENEWNRLDCVQLALQPLLQATKILEDNNNVTSSLVVCLLYEIRVQLQDRSKYSNDDLDGVTAVRVVTGQMLSTLNELFGDFMSNPFCGVDDNRLQNERFGLDRALIFAHALDPRFKKLKVFEKNARENVWKQLLHEMVKLRPSSTDGEEPTVKAAETKVELSKESRQSLGAYAALDNSDSSGDEKDNDRNEDSWEAACSVELSGFKLEKGIKFDDPGEPCPLKWWSERIFRFPTLWKLCQLYFSIPATAAPGNRAFRIDGNKAVFKRCELVTSSTEESLHCVYENKWVLQQLNDSPMS